MERFYIKKRIERLTKEEKKKIIKKLIVLLGATTLVGCIYSLKPIYIGICVIFTLLILPGFYRENEKEIKFRNRFECVVTYLEQMLYSFKKRPKIREALIDAQKTSDNYMKELIEEVVVNIDTKMSDNIYEESLKIIEDEYPCRRVKSVHEFITKIEKQGGEYESYINILLQDIKAWNDRTRLFVKNVKRIKRNILISIGSTLLTCAFMTHIVPKDYSYSDKIAYQISTTVMLVIMMSVYYFVTKKLNFDWMKEAKGLDPRFIDRYYQIIYENRGKTDKLNWMERSNYRTAKKRLEREVMREFPDWMRETAVNLQIETVQSAIENSYENAAYVMKEPIKRILLDFEQYPVGIEPYDNFLKELDVKEVKSSMKMLYSMGELGKEESDVQIGSIIDRNIKLENQSEEMKNSDRVGAASFLSVVPMFVGVIKIMLDMLLMILVFTGELSNVMQSGGI